MSPFRRATRWLNTRSSTRRDLDGQPVLLVEREDAPTYHDATVAYCAALDVRPAWVMHPASQVERMLDMVAVGSGIGWLNAWQAAQRQPRRRRDPPVASPSSASTSSIWCGASMIDSKSVQQFVEIAMEACKS